MSEARPAACGTCPHACAPPAGKRGMCRSRRADGQAVEPEGYGRVTAIALDPIEKKPIARWQGGATVLSLGATGATCAARSARTPR